MSGFACSATGRTSAPRPATTTTNPSSSSSVCSSFTVFRSSSTIITFGTGLSPCHITARKGQAMPVPTPQYTLLFGLMPVTCFRFCYKCRIQNVLDMFRQHELELLTNICWKIIQVVLILLGDDDGI